MTAQTSTKPASIYYVSDGREACGLVVCRGKTAFEAIADDGETSLGLFETAAAAATACWRHAHRQQER
jgi:hypothetical protein